MTSRLSRRLRVLIETTVKTVCYSCPVACATAEYECHCLSHRFPHLLLGPPRGLPQERLGDRCGEAHASPQGNFRESSLCLGSPSPSWGEVNQPRNRISRMSRIPFLQMHLFRLILRSWKWRLPLFPGHSPHPLIFRVIIHHLLLLTPSFEAPLWLHQKLWFAFSRGGGHSSPHWVQLSLWLRSLFNFKQKITTRSSPFGNFAARLAAVVGDSSWSFFTVIPAGLGEAEKGAKVWAQRAILNWNLEGTSKK